MVLVELTHTKYNSAGGFIAPGQGFMVGAKGHQGDKLIIYNKYAKTANGGDDFISGDIMDDDRAELFIKFHQSK